MKIRVPLLAVVVSTLLLAGCGGSASNDLATFTAPNGWRGGGFGGYSMWIGPDNGGHSEVLMLMRLPYRPGTNEDLSFATARYGNDAKIKERKSITICGSQPANYLDMVGTDKNGKRSDVQMVSTRYAKTVYIAMYVHDAGARPNPEANADLRNLCLKK